MSPHQLLPHHQELLEASAISEEVVRERGYWSATKKAELEALGFGRKAQRVPSLVIPIHSVTGEVEWCAHRPDEPRVADGTARKYEIPYGAHQILDVPPRVRPLLRDPQVTLVITEGPRKVDSAISHGLICIGVFGTYAFRGTDSETQGKVMLGDWEHVALKSGVDEGREVFVCFDSDVMRKPEVQNAFDRLLALLHRRGAKVGYILLPEGEHGSKVGLDDFFDAGRSVEELWSCATRERPRWPPDKPDSRTDGSKAAPLRQESVRQANRANRTHTGLRGEPPELARRKNILAEFERDMRRLGVAGDVRLAKIVYLAVTGRVFPFEPAEPPVPVIGKGQSSSGKSYEMRRAIDFFPEDAVIKLGSMSRRYLFYSEDDLAHTFLYVPEWGAIDDDDVLTTLKNLTTEGRVVHCTVEGDAKRTERKIEKAGPTGLLVTTTLATVDHEMETRCVSSFTDDTPAQTKRILEAYADREERLNYRPVNLGRWHELQEWIAFDQGGVRVFIPYVRALAEKMPPNAIRLRRDFGKLLRLIRAHAVLHRAGRKTDGRGRIIATIHDYAAVRDLYGPLIAQGVQADVAAAVRETVEVVKALIAENGGEHAKATEVVKRLPVEKEASYARIRRAEREGYLVNLSDKGQPKRLAISTPLPRRETEFLPSPEEVVRWLSSRATGQIFGSTIRVEGDQSGFPVVPVRPPEAPVDGSQNGTSGHVVVSRQVDWDGNLSLSGTAGACEEDSTPLLRCVVCEVDKAVDKVRLGITYLRCGHHLVVEPGR